VGPWLCLGDFNFIISSLDKRGGRCFAASTSGGLLANFINQKGLIGLGFSGNPFTWSNGHCGLANIKETLDIGVEIKNGDCFF
jgi:hypothetical protein